MKQKTKTLVSRAHPLSGTSQQLKKLGEPIQGVQPFAQRIKSAGFDRLKPTKLEVLQINLGYLCNMTCEHCHVDAGPERRELMSKSTMESCLNVVDLLQVETVDLTGGAPEMNPHFIWFVEELSKRKVRVIVRSNLTILVSNKKYSAYPEFFKKNNVVVVASLPCYTAQNTDKQRGDGAFEDSIKALKKLNELGYGESSELNLVYNPGGPSIAPDQSSLEADYKRELKANFDVDFSNLYTITNLPISRFLDFLIESGRYIEYMQKLSDSFNPHAVGNVMCRNTISVDYLGNLYDCDFNQMLNLKVEGKIKHISDILNDEIEQRNIVLNQHCYGCTAGAGSSCGGALV